MEMTNSLVRLWVTPEYKFELYLKGLAYFFSKIVKMHQFFCDLAVFTQFFSRTSSLRCQKSKFLKEKKAHQFKVCSKTYLSTFSEVTWFISIGGCLKKLDFYQKIRNNFSFSKNLMSTLFFWKYSIKSQLGI